MDLSLRQMDRRYTSVAAVTADLELAEKMRNDLHSSQEVYRQRLRFWSLVAHRADHIEKETSLRINPDEWASRATQLLENDMRQLDEINICIAALTRVKAQLEAMFSAAPKPE